LRETGIADKTEVIKVEPRNIIIVGGIVLALVAVSRLLRRRRRRGPLKRARHEVERAVGEIESTLEELAARAKKLRGEALETVEVQIRALENRRHDLNQRLQAVGSESKKAVHKVATAAATATK
jgi:hypothetical protein